MTYISDRIWLFIVGTPFRFHIREPNAVHANRRRGAASVECAVCLPLLVLIVLGTIEVCSVVFLQQALQTTVYETARIAASPLGDTLDAAKAGRDIMDRLELQGGTVTVETSELPGDSAIKLVTATAALPVASNRILKAWVISVPQLSAQCTMVKEVDQTY
ncbi:MAG: pilus assembly protein [Planctomycetes bacterium]|nr:pilus assembly protein [Planctomycetota bacterium]